MHARDQPILQENIRHCLAKLRHVLLDMDGTIYSGSRLFPFTLKFLADLTEAHIGYTFLTNNCSRSVEQYVQKLRGLGIMADADSLLTSMHATVFYLRHHHPRIKRLFVLGTDGLKSDLAAAGFQMACGDASGGEPEAVVVGFDTQLTYANLCAAAWWVKRGKLFIATHPDVFCPTDQPTLLVDCGAVTRCIEEAAGRRADAVLGKPHETMIQPILERWELLSDQAVMVGDRLTTDVRMGQQAGLLSVLVLTGDAVRDDIERLGVQPDLVVEDLEQLGRLIAQSRGGAR
ncbi:MAG: HAD-IIA family hydrolase [Phycisphaeraceae bacterium]|nr:HAD-IIA family hydrolase [Phycisphaeraceae bacterium]